VDAIPESTQCWVSGGFDSESATREGWENGQGAVRSGESSVHTFETEGIHEYSYSPHEAAGMAGTVVKSE
jgi:plastocyanin